MRVVYICSIVLSLCLCHIATGQSLLGGQVSNQLDHPIEGVSIGDQRGTIIQKTDQLGLFHLKGLSEGDTLFFNHLLYRDTIIIYRNDMKFLNVVMDDADHAIEEVEVISTGYQQIPRERSTGSFSVISNERISEQIGFNIMDRIPAVASGIVLDRNSRGGSGQLLVRGMSTILGETDPLIVLDNFPYEGNLSSINPDDIETITVLRDAAAASIWGARAGNGVIVITSKKGSINQKLKTNFSTLTSVETKPNLFSIDRISSSDMIDVEEMLFENGYYNSMINSNSKPVLSPAVELFIQRASASDSKAIAEIESELQRLRNLDVRNDFLKYMYRPGFQQQSTVGLSQGSDRLVWNASASNAILKGTLGEKNSRNTFVTNARVNLGKSLVVDGGINISFLGGRSGRLGYGDVSANQGLFPYAEFADDRGNPLPVFKDWRGPFLDNEVHPEMLDWKYYPLEDYRYSVNGQKSQNTLLSAALEYSLPKWISLSLRYQYQNQTSVTENLRTIDSYEARNMVNGYTVVNDATGRLDYQLPKGGILDRINNNRLAHNLRGQLNFNWDKSVHHIYGLLGTEIRSVSSNFDRNRHYGYNPDNLSFSVFDLTVPYLHYVTGNRTTIPHGLSLGQNQDRYISAYFNASYTLFDKYTATFSARRDASNLFGLNVNDKWNPFWSTGVAWDISKERFWSDRNYSGSLKLRATYGRTGNVNPAMVAQTTIRYTGSNPYTQTPFARFDNYANPELRWESVSMANVGVDFAIYDNRISGTIEAYYKEATDLYGTSPIDYTSGVPAYLIKNVAKMSANGVDLTLNTVNTQGKVKWMTNLHTSMTKDRVLDYHVGTDVATQFIMSINSVSGSKGAPVFSMYSYRWMGLDSEDGAPLGILNGESSRDYRQFTGANATLDDLIFHGRVQPTFFGSMGNTFAWKDWSVTFRMTYKFGYYVRRETVKYGMLFSRWDGHKDYYLRWQKPGDETRTDVPAMIYPLPSGAENFYPFAEPFVERGDHIRLEYVNLSYHLPNRAKNTWFRDASITFNVNNLGLLYRKNTVGLDPDYSLSSTTNFPPARIYSLTLKCAL